MLNHELLRPCTRKQFLLAIGLSLARLQLGWSLAFQVPVILAMAIITGGVYGLREVLLLTMLLGPAHLSLFGFNCCLLSMRSWLPLPLMIVVALLLLAWLPAMTVGVAQLSLGILLAVAASLASLGLVLTFAGYRAWLCQDFEFSDVLRR